MKAIILAIVLLSVWVTAPAAKAGFILHDGRVSLVSNTSGNTKRFTVLINGGTGVCAGAYLSFREENAGDRDVFKRAFAIALTALATGKTVDVYSYGADDCISPSFIMIKN